MGRSEESTREPLAYASGTRRRQVGPVSDCALRIPTLPPLTPSPLSPLSLSHTGPAPVALQVGRSVHRTGRRLPAPGWCRVSVQAEWTSRARLVGLGTAGTPTPHLSSGDGGLPGPATHAWVPREPPLVASEEEQERRPRAGSGIPAVRTPDRRVAPLPPRTRGRRAAGSADVRC